MKKLLGSIIFLILFSCSNIPKDFPENISEELLIEKPQINYKLNSLPKDINVIYFVDSESKKQFPDEVKGLLTNYYLFSKNNNYFPNIKFINLSLENSCSLNINRTAYNFLFVLEKFKDKKSYKSCINRFINRNTLLATNFNDISLPKASSRLVVDRNDDKFELLKLMDLFSSNTMVIDNEFTNDKYEIGDFWKKKFNKEIAEYKTFNKKESSQDIFSNLLLIDQSLKRKRKLTRIMSRDLNHKSRTRQDINGLFLSVNTQEARSLKPALDYNYFEGMKVFLANDWKGNIQFTKTDKDLEGVISIDIPFMIATNLPKELKDVGRRTRSFAIGYDSFEIFLLLNGKSNLQKITYKGLTGRVTFQNNIIKRESTIFRIKNGAYEFLN